LPQGKNGTGQRWSKDHEDAGFADQENPHDERCGYDD
jgi:hypothetical protein